MDRYAVRVESGHAQVEHDLPLGLPVVAVGREGGENGVACLLHLVPCVRKKAFFAKIGDQYGFVAVQGCKRQCLVVVRDCR